ncbi:MAG: hypothetical protein LBV26_03705 [Bacteroidales bacterium]|jgi:hypothetical protein|nr:hypothetical protein [Bacteroidales bacterium]
MNKFTVILLFALTIAGCGRKAETSRRIPIAEVGRKTLYYDEIPQVIIDGLHEADSAATVQNYINKWAKHELLLMRAEANLSQSSRAEIAAHMEETRAGLLIYQYQKQMMLERMDTIIRETDLEAYYDGNNKSFSLLSNIVKALYIKLPVTTPDIGRIRSLARSGSQADMQQLEGLCYNVAEKFEDFGENWTPIDRLLVEMPGEIIGTEESFLRRNTFYEASDSLSVYMLAIRDYRLRSSLAPYEYVKDDIKRIIMNSRRFEFMQSLENRIYNDALKEKHFKIY